VLGSLSRHGEGDQPGPAVKPLAAKNRLELGATAEAEAPFYLRRPGRRRSDQPLSAFAAAVAEHVGSAAGAHPAQESVHAPAVPFLGLICSFDRASLAEAEITPPQRQANQSGLLHRFYH
jgi:hypothetical protein